MTTLEWYSGFDATGRVEAVVDRLSRQLDKATPSVESQTLQSLKEAIELEEEPNWLALLSGLLGMTFEALGFPDEALEAYESLLLLARPDLPTFDDTLNVYCQSTYHAARMLLERKEYAGAVRWLLFTIPYMQLVFENEHVCAISRFTDDCFTALGQTGHALPFAEAAAFYCDADASTLQFLVEAYRANGLESKAEAVLNRLSEMLSPENSGAEAD